jgi:hypothetical protein
VLGLVLRRLRVQRRLLLGVTALVAAGSTLLGVGTLLLTLTQERALVSDVRRVPPQDLETTAFLVRVANRDVGAVREDARRVVGSALAPLGSTTSSGAVSAMRRLGGDGRRAYLASSDDLSRRARLVSGRWAAGSSVGSPLEATVPEATARLLGLRLGSRLTLGRELAGELVERPVTVEVVGTFRARSRAAWEQDPLSGTGFDPAYSDGARSAPTYGPFEVGADALVASGSSFASVQVTARPRLGAVTGPALTAVAGRLGSADARLSAAVGDRVEIERVASSLPQTLDQVRVQQAAVRSTVLVAVLLGTVLVLVALLLAGRTTWLVRAEQQRLLVDLGASGSQLAGAAAAEGGLLALAAALVATPAASLLHAWLTHLPVLAAAGLAQSPSLSGGLVTSVLTGSLVLTGVLVLSALRPGTSAGSGRLARSARSGADVVLLGLVAASWWQLRALPKDASGSGDVVQTMAPVLGLVAASVVVVRLLPPILRVLAGGAVRSRRLLVPLAVLEAARRPHPVTASVLLVASMASATFALALGSTWQQSQSEQAALRVGTDLSVSLTDAPSGDDGARLAGATGGVVSAVTARSVALGRYVGDRGDAPTLVAIDGRRAGELLRGRAPAGTSWSDLGRTIAPARQAAGPEISGDGVELRGEVSGSGAGAQVTPTLVVQGAEGLRTPLRGDPVALDGRPHPLRWSSSVAAGQRLVAVQLVVKAPPGLAVLPGRDSAPVRVTITLPGGGPPAGAWEATSLGQSPTSATSPEVDVRGGGDVTVVRATARLSLATWQYADARLLATAFSRPSVVPVVVSRDLARSVGTKVGGTVEVSVDGVSVPARVRAVVPTVPSAPGRIAVLADQDLLSRALLSVGRLDPTADAWWVGHPRPGAAARTKALGLGDVVSRSEVADRLAAGPPGVLVPVVLLVLVLAALGLALAGTSLSLAAELGLRAAELARLRALGLTRRMVVRLLLLQHGAVLTLLLVLGTVVGAGASVGLGPLLVRSDLGVAPVPGVRVVWPWGGELAVVGGLVLGCLVVTAVLATRHVRRTDASLLRPGGE